MTNPENPAFIRFRDRFEPYPTYANPERAPKTVVTQTDSMIGLLGNGNLSGDYIQRYITGYTFPFLKTAAEGVGRVFDKTLLTADRQPTDTNEAAEFANIVFGWMHYFTRNAYLPDGFARRGMLRAPQDEDEFVRRLREIKYQLAGMAAGVIDTRMTFETSVAAFRTYQFFRVGALMPLKFPESEREKEQRAEEMIEKLLEGIDDGPFRES